MKYNSFILLIFFLMPLCRGMGNVIIMNGPAAVGKTTLINAFTKESSAVWQSISFDSHFIAPLQAYIFEKQDSQVAVLETKEENGKPLTLAQFGQQGQNAMRGVFAQIAATAKEGNNVIFDFTCYDSSWAEQLSQRLGGLKVFWVGLTLSLEENEKREKERGTTTLGLVRAYHKKCHENIKYDLVIDTQKTMIEESVAKLKELLSHK